MKKELRQLRKHDTFKHKGKTYQFEKFLPKMSEVYLIQKDYSPCKVRLENTLEVEVVKMEQ